MPSKTQHAATPQCAFCGAETRPAMTRCRICGRPLRAAGGDGASAPEPTRRHEPPRPATIAGHDPLGIGDMLEKAEEILDSRDSGHAKGHARAEPSAHPGGEPRTSSNVNSPHPQHASARSSPAPVQRSNFVPAATTPQAPLANSPQPPAGSTSTPSLTLNDASTAGADQAVDADVIWLDCECGRQLRVKRSKAGKRVRCPKCEKPVPVPNVAPATEMGSANPSLFRRLADEIRDQFHPLPTAKRTLSVLKFRKLSAALKTEGASTAAIDERSHALAALGESKDARAFDLLMSALDDPAPRVREAAVEALGDCGDPRAIPVLLGLLDPDTVPLHRAAMASLAKLADRRTVRPILQYSREAPHARFLAADAIVKMEEAAIPPLLEIVNDGDGGIALEAIVLLGRIRDKKAVKALVQVLETRSPIFRSHAAEALGNIGDARVVSSLLPLLRDHDLGVRVNVAAALVKLPDPQAVPTLIQALGDADENVRVHVIGALGEIGDPRAAEPLCRQLAGTSDAIRLAAAEALGQIGDSRAADALLSLIHEQDETLQLKAIAALRRLKEPRVAAALLPLLDHPSDAVRQRTVDTLGQIGDAQIAARLEKILQTDRSEGVRVAAAKALGDIKDPASIDALQDALHDDFAVRCRAVMSLGAIGDDAALPALLAMLRDPVPELRYHAAAALGDLGHPNAKDPLAPLLEDSNAMVRRGAAKALQRLGDPRGEEMLQVSRVKQFRRALQRAIATVAPGIVLAVLWPESPRGRMILLGSLGAILLGVALVLVAPMLKAPAVVIPRGTVSSAGFTSDGHVAVGRNRGMIEIWDVQRGTLQKSIPTTLGEIKRVAAGASGNSVLMIGAKDVQVAADAGLQALSGHQQPVRKTDVSAGNKWAVSIAADGVAYVWNLDSMQAQSALALAPKVTAIAVGEDGGTVASATESVVSILESRTGTVLHQLRLPAAATALAYSPDSATLAVAIDSGPIHLFDVATGKETSVVGTSGPGGEILRFAPGGDALVSASGRSLHVWDVTSGMKRTSAEKLPVPGGVTAMALSRDGKLAALGSAEATGVVIVDLSTGQVVKTLDVPQ